MTLKLKTRTSMPKKVLIYGMDGTGKSTFAEQYCKENNLHPVCLDVDDTNFTNIPCIEFERSTHLKVKEQVLQFIKDVQASDDFDTIVIDGISSLLLLLVSNSKGISKYGDRTNALNKIINELARSRLNFILVGQIDMTISEEVSTAVVNINSIVNEKYYCSYDEATGKYKQEVKKYRGLEQVEAEARKEIKKEPAFATANNVKPLDVDPVVLNYCKTIKKQVESAGKEVTKGNMKRCLTRMVNNGEIDNAMRPKILVFINKHCLEVLE